MLRKVSLLAVLALASCGSFGTSFRYTDTEYAPTRMDDVQVLDDVPAGAEIIGEVEGRDSGPLSHSALDDARQLAAALGAHAIVVEGVGTARMEGDIFGRRVEAIRAKAIRFAGRE